MSTDTVKWHGADSLVDHIIAIDELKRWEGNARRGDVPALMKSLERWGQVGPIKVAKGTPGVENNTIVAGHHVFEAARRLEWTHVAAIPIAFKNRSDARDYLIADNQLAALGHVDPVDQMDLLEEVERSGSWEGTGFTAEDLEDARALSKHRTEEVKVDDLKKHHRNYKEHPADQLEHLTSSLREHGFYRNIVVAKDGTVLAGHGMLEAARKVGLHKVPVTRLPIEPDSDEALKVVAGDNELGRLAELDDRTRADMLKSVREGGGVEALVGTGFDAQTLSALVMVTRPASEIKDHDAAAEWLQLPDFQGGGQRIQLIVSFADEAARDECCEKLGIEPHYRRTGEGGGGKVWSTWYPPRPREDLKSVKFTDGDGQPMEEAFPPGPPAEPEEELRQEAEQERDAAEAGIAPVRAPEPEQGDDKLVPGEVIGGAE